jgi:hypothetical protein
VATRRHLHRGLQPVLASLQSKTLDTSGDSTADTHSSYRSNAYVVKVAADLTRELTTNLLDDSTFNFASHHSPNCWSQHGCCNTGDVYSGSAKSVLASLQFRLESELLPRAPRAKVAAQAEGVLPTHTRVTHGIRSSRIWLRTLVTRPLR